MGKINNGFLMVNNRKQQPSHSDYTGKVTLADGKDYYISAWKNVSKKGEEYLSLSIGKAVALDRNAGSEMIGKPKAKGSSPQESFCDDDINF